MGKKLTLLSTSMLATILAFSQQDTLHGNALDPVIVTANKTEQKQSSTGKVISIISKEEIEKNTGKTVAQLLNTQAGITVNGALNSAGTVQTVFMRGAASGRTLILIDGIPTSDPSMINNEMDLNLFSLNDVERIEICKGAQSTLYGSDAIAGVINIITVKNDIKKAVNIKATASGGSYETFKGNVQVYGKIGKLTYTTRYAKLYTDGFSAAYDSTGAKNFDKDGYNGNSTNAALKYQVNDALSVRTFVQYSQYKADIDAGVFSDKTNYFINNKSLFTGAGFNYKKAALTVTGNYQYSHSTRHYDDNYASGSTTYSTNDYRSYSNFYELFASYKLNKNFTVLLGNDFRFASMDGSYYSSVWLASPYKDSSMHQYSAYASLLFASNNKKLNIELGGRYNNHSRYGTNYTYTFNPSYKITDRIRVFGSIASGFKAPSIYQLYDTYSGNTNLKAETSVNYETGIQQDFSKFSHRLVYFYRDITSGIDYNYISYQYFNFTEQKTNGIEYEISIHPTTQLNITANYAWLDTKETTESRVNYNDTTYAYALRRPKHNINLTIAYQFTPALYASINGKYVSSRYDVGGYKKPDVLMNDYFLVNAYAEYALKKSIKFFADAQNIGNKKFFDIRGYNSIPFMFNIGATLSL